MCAPPVVRARCVTDTPDTSTTSAGAAEPNPEKELLDYQNYAVAFFDVVGQSDQLLQFGPLEETEPERIETVLHPAVSHIRHLRNLFERNFTEVGKPSVLLDD